MNFWLMSIDLMRLVASARQLVPQILLRNPSRNNTSHHLAITARAFLDQEFYQAFPFFKLTRVARRMNEWLWASVISEFRWRWAEGNGGKLISLLELARENAVNRD
ncbi:hypothetical protein AKJ16_DCAP24635 [Drosera capensis]